MDNNNNENLQSRREFFKSAVKAVLPVLGVVALAGSPIIAKAAMGCDGDCWNICKGGCKENCDYGCKDNCTSCQGYCSGKCGDQCTGNCLSHCVDCCF